MYRLADPETVSAELSVRAREVLFDFSAGGKIMGRRACLLCSPTEEAVYGGLRLGRLNGLLKLLDGNRNGGLELGRISIRAGQHDLHALLAFLVEEV